MQRADFRYAKLKFQHSGGACQCQAPVDDPVMTFRQKQSHDHSREYMYVRNNSINFRDV